MGRESHKPAVDEGIPADAPPFDRHQVDRAAKDEQAPSATAGLRARSGAGIGWMGGRVGLTVAGGQFLAHLRTRHTKVGSRRSAYPSADLR